ncbi:MAG TPA: type VI secretion system baseplate subunit TssF, partial [Blastocatellia bacterium]|nr:type VI secretion system baseplate subunit TssF [Blastocatellia bacterium]
FLNGEPQLVYALYELIFNNTSRVEIRPGKMKHTASGPRRDPAAIHLPASSLESVGFGRDEGMLPYSARSFTGYRLLTEYFAFPDKFLFFDVTGLADAARAGFGQEFEIVIELRNVRPPSVAVDHNTFQLGCAPVVNLFGKVAEPIQLTQQQYEYHVVPDVHRQMATELYSVDGVTTSDGGGGEAREFRPFYFRSHGDREGPRDTLWYATRRPSQRKDDPGTECYLSLVDLGFSPNVPPVDTVMVRTTCTNRDLPAKLPFGGLESDFQTETTGPVSRVRCLKKPTATLRPPLRRGAQWRLISHLSLNHLSLLSESGQPDALREILLLYDFMDSAATRKQIAGIERVDSRMVVRQMGGRVGAGFVRGVETTIEFDEDQYVGSGVFLFASVLERFLGLYVSMNSFNQLVVKVKQREGILKRWLPRAGEQILL